MNKQDFNDYLLVPLLVLVIGGILCAIGLVCFCYSHL